MMLSVRDADSNNITARCTRSSGVRPLSLDKVTRTCAVLGRNRTWYHRSGSGRFLFRLFGDHCMWYVPPFRGPCLTYVQQIVKHNL